MSTAALDTSHLLALQEAEATHGADTPRALLHAIARQTVKRREQEENERRWTREQEAARRRRIADERAQFEAEMRWGRI